MTGWIKKLAGIGLMLVVWQAVAVSGVISPEFFPTVPTIAASLVALARSGRFLLELASTWGRTLAGLAVAVVIAVAVALLTGRFRVVKQVLDPAVEMLRALPPPAIVPISIFAFGLGPQLFIFIIAFAAVWPIYINTANALAAGERVQILAARSFGYGDWAILLRLRFPAALPEIITGVRLAAGIALLAAVAAEMLAGQNGLGFLLYDAAFTLHTAQMFAIMFLVGVSGLLLNLLMALARHLLIGWHQRLVATGERL